MNRERIIRKMRLNAGRLGYTLILPAVGTQRLFLVEGHGRRGVHADSFDAMKEFLQV